MMVERRTGQPDAMGAREMLAALLDRETFSSWDTPPAEAKQDPAYAAELAAARDKTGLDESVITGSGRIRGRQVAVATSEFGFLGGSIGVAAGQRLVAAIDLVVAGANARLSPAEQVRRFAVLVADLSEAGGSVTPTMKLKRGALSAQVRGIVDRLYLGPARPA